jgi:hypothetical protein
MSTPLARIFPDEDFKFQLRFERGEAAEFFAPTPEHAALVAERRRWLRTEPEKYAALLPPGEPLLAEVLRLAQDWNGFTPLAAGAPVSDPARTESAQRRAGSEIGTANTAAPWSTLLALGEFWEADFLLLKAEGGEIRLYGGCLCFPSSWRLSDKIGKPIEFIHGPVPGLNESIGQGIHKFLTGLKPGAASLRHNWGLARSPELNHHPDRKLPRLDADTKADEVWLRIEHQALVALPQSGGILFGIRVANHAFAQVKADVVARVRLRRALETMPDDLARYKGLSAIRQQLVGWLVG